VTLARHHAVAIGTRFALGHGVSSGIALLRSRQAVLDLATGPDAATAVMLTRLGLTLSTVPLAAAAPMRATPMPATYAFEADPSSATRSDSLEATTRRMATPRVALTSGTVDRPAISPTREEHRPRDTRLSAVDSSAQLSDGGRRTPHFTPQRASMRRATHASNPSPFAGERTHEAGMTPPPAGGSHALIAMPPSADVPSPAPTTNVPSPKITADTPSFAPVANPPSPNLEFRDTDAVSGIMQTISSALVSQVSIAQLGYRADERGQPTMQPPYISAETFEHVSAAPIDTPGSQDDTPGNGAAFGPTPPQYLRLAYPTQDATTAALADNRSRSTQTDQEPRQGMIVFDGAELGRWVISYLESQALRPGTMTTGIDPRMTATFPGAPTGG
jgi:hypothetical protein